MNTISRTEALALASVIAILVLASPASFGFWEMHGYPYQQDTTGHYDACDHDRDDHHENTHREPPFREGGAYPASQPTLWHHHDGHVHVGEWEAPDCDDCHHHCKASSCPSNSQVRPALRSRDSGACARCSPVQSYHHHN